AGVDSCPVLLNNVVSLTSVSSLCSGFHQLDRLVLRNDSGKFEECGLQDRIDTCRSHAGLDTDLNAVDGVELDVVVCDKRLHLSRKMFLKTFHIPRTVQKECTSVYQFLNHVVLVHIRRIMACYKVSFVDQVCRFDRFLTKTKVGHGNAAGLLGVIVKVSLRVHVSVIADDLDGVLVRTNSTVSAKSPELAVGGSFRCCYNSFSCLKGKVCNVIHDTNSKFLFFSVVVNSNDLCRCGVFGTKSVTSGEYRNIFELRIFQSSYNIEIQRIAQSARVFCSVKNSDLFHRFRNRIDQGLRAERSVKTNFDNADFLSCCHQIIDSLFDSIVYRTHCNDHVLSVCSSIIVEQFVVCTDLLVYFVHVALYYCRKSVIVRVTCFSCLEEDIRVLSGSSLAGMIGIQGMFTEFSDGIHISHVFQILIIPCLDLLD